MIIEIAEFSHGNMSIVHDNTPDQINISVDWLPEV